MAEFTTFGMQYDLTRSTPRWNWGPDGKIVKYDTDKPSFQYDPVTGKALGVYLNSESVTNLQTDTRGSSVSSRSGGVIETGLSAPDGSNDAVKITHANGSTSGGTWRGFQTKGKDTVYFLIYVKKQNSQNEVLLAESGVWVPNERIQINKSTGNTTGGSKYFDIKTIDAGDWWQVTFGMDLVGGNSANVKFKLYAVGDDNDNYDVLFGFSCFDRPYSGYIPTNGSAVTVAGDQMKIKTALDNGHNTLYLELDAGQNDTSDWMNVASYNTEGGRGFPQSKIDGDIQLSPDNNSNRGNGIPTQWNQLNKIATSWDANSMRMALNGNDSSSISYGIEPKNSRSIRLLSRNTSGLLKSIFYIPEDSSIQELKDLTQ